VAESVELWWARRQWTKGAAVPYPVGRYREDWQRYPVLIRQYHPDLNQGLVLSQVPPAGTASSQRLLNSGHDQEGRDDGRPGARIARAWQRRSGSLTPRWMRSSTHAGTLGTRDGSNTTRPTTAATFAVGSTALSSAVNSW
jgi:hypothetical protein